jgi:uncharacterized protein YtpQ (UPF0354 family)
VSSEAAFTESAAGRVRAIAPQLGVRITGPLAFDIEGRPGSRGPLKVSLGRVWILCGKEPAGCDQEVDHFVAVLLRVGTSTAQLPERSQILPELRPRSYLDAMGAVATNVVVQPFIDDLVVLYVVDSPDSTRSLTASDVQALHLSSAEVAAIGRENLARHLAPHPLAIDAIRAGEVYVLGTGDFYESSRLLDEKNWAAIAARAPGPLVVAAPQNDIVIFVAGIDSDRLAGLRDVVRRGYEKAARPVSPNLYRWQEGGWAVLP